MSKNLVEGKKVTTEMIRQFVKGNQLDKLAALLPKAEKYQVADSLFCSAYRKVGNYLIEKERFAESIIVYNKVRVRDYKSKSVLTAFIKAIDLFFKQNVKEFSKNDLEEFNQIILPILDFHKLKYPEHKQIVDSTNQMFKRIDYRIKYVAKELEESRVTFRVQQIKDALYGDMTFEEVQQEFARLLVPKLRERLSEEDEEIDKSKKKKPSKKKKKGKNKDN